MPKKRSYLNRQNQAIENDKLNRQNSEIQLKYYKFYSQLLSKKIEIDI